MKRRENRVKARIVKLERGCAFEYLLLRNNNGTIELILDHRSCAALGFQDGDELTLIARKAKSQAPDSTVPRFNRIIPESEWKNLKLMNLKAALNQSEGRIFGPQGAARLLGVGATTLFERIRKAGLKKNEFHGLDMVNSGED